MPKKYIIANWKMLPQTWAEAEHILDYINDDYENNQEQEQSLVICPPFVFLEEVCKLFQTSHLEHNT